METRTGNQRPGRCREVALGIEHVALNQTRFNTPGVAPDNRGVLLGKQGALLFASVDRLVGFFRIFCDESSMDDLLPKLKIESVVPAELTELICTRLGICPNCTSSGAVTDEVMTSGLAPG